VWENVFPPGVESEGVYERETPDEREESGVNSGNNINATRKEMLTAGKGRKN